jgi:dihydrofolate reductase
MRKIVVTEFMTLDGVVEDPGGAEAFDRGGWSFKFPDDEGMKYKLDEVRDHDAMLLGRVTYEGFAEAWPGREDEMGFAAKMNSMAKYVVSTTLEDPAWNNSSVIAENVADEVTKLKQQDGGDILVAGSVTLVQFLHEHGLVDEYRLMVFPIVLGAGKRLFGETADATTLGLTDSKALASGTVILTYAPKR